MVTIVFREGHPPAAAHRQLMVASHPDWPAEQIRRVRRAFAGIEFCATAWAGQQLIGTVRTFSDRVNFAVVADLLIHPDYRRQGVASNLLAICRQRYRGFYLYADPASATLLDLYLKNGWSGRTVARLYSPLGRQSG